MEGIIITGISKANAFNIYTLHCQILLQQNICYIGNSSLDIDCMLGFRSLKIVVKIFPFHIFVFQGGKITETDMYFLVFGKMESFI